MYKTQIACLIIVIFISVFYFTASNRQSASSKCFAKLLITSLLQLIFDIISVYTVNHLETVPRCINRIVHIFFMSLILTMLYLVYKYIESAIEEEIKEHIKRHNYTAIPLIVTILGTIFLPLHYIESDTTNYSYGPAAFTAYIGIAVYVALILKLLFRYSKTIPKKKKNAIYIALICEIPIAIYQIIIPEALITCLAITLLIFGIYLTTENPDALLVEQLEREKKRADDANTAKTNFLANMSHEIRTPINTVLGMNEMIIRETAEDEIRKYAFDVKSATKSLLSIINDILDITKIEAGKLDIINVKYDFSSLINNITNMISFKAKAKELKFKADIDESIPRTLIGDDIRLRQILVNILNNAVKYTNKGHIIFKVEYLHSEEPNEANIRFSVKDTGIGIKEENIEKLCIPFERIDEMRNRNIEGTGLGMSITNQLLDLLHSKLHVKSEYGVGSEFSFTLKQEIIDSTPIGKLETLIDPPSKGYSYKRTYEAPNANILIVDDNEMNRRVFVNLLKSTKMTIDQASSGQACLEKVAQKKYDIIFLDHMMPQMDGIETFNIMKQMEDYPSKGTPVVILTANAVVGAKEMYLEQGFDEFLAKPIDYRKLETLIQKLLSESGVAITRLDTLSTENNVVPTQTVKTNTIANSELPMIDGLDWKYANTHFVNESMLIDTLKFFYSTIDYDANELERLSQDIFNDVGRKKYQVKVHSMKSSAAILGIIPLAGMAKILENAARDGNMDILTTITPTFLNLWRNYKNELSVMMPSEEAPNKKTSDADIQEINQILRNIKLAAISMDIGTLDNLWEKLSTYEFDTDKAEYIENIHKAIVNFDVDYLQVIDLL